MTNFSQSLLWTPKKSARLSDFSPQSTEGLESKKEIEAKTKKLQEELQNLQEKLAASKQQAVLFVFQGMDCSGKDGVIKNVFAGLNQQGVNVFSFKSPTEEERKHDFIWRTHKVAPGLGQIGIFNRSYYEDVLIARVHGIVTEAEAKQRFKHINHFEDLLIGSGVAVVKIFLHISKDFQLDKIKERINDPQKNWKFDPSDLQERKYWKQYQAYYQDVFNKCSKNAPWHIVPSDNRWFRNYAVLQIAVDALRALNLQDPPPNPELKTFLAEISTEKA